MGHNCNLNDILNDAAYAILDRNRNCPLVLLHGTSQLDNFLFALILETKLTEAMKSQNPIFSKHFPNRPVYPKQLQEKIPYKFINLPDSTIETNGHSLSIFISNSYHFIETAYSINVDWIKNEGITF